MTILSLLSSSYRVFYREADVYDERTRGSAYNEIRKYTGIGACKISGQKMLILKLSNFPIFEIHKSASSYAFRSYYCAYKIIKTKRYEQNYLAIYRDTLDSVFTAVSLRYVMKFQRRPSR